MKSSMSPAEDRAPQWEAIKADVLGKLKGRGIEVPSTAAPYQIYNAINRVRSREFAKGLGLNETATDDEIDAKNDEMNLKTPASADAIFHDVNSRIHAEFGDFFRHWNMNI